MTRALLALAAAACLAACHRETPGAPPGPPPAPAPAAPKRVEAAAAPAVRAPADAGPSVADEELVEEAPEADPRSETVTIKLVAEPSRKARVLWGRKDLGLAPLELQRPRNSGPLDLLVLAPGALPLHTRVFTDRDDKIALRLVAESDAPSLLGYRPQEAPPEKTARSDGGRQRRSWPSR